MANMTREQAKTMLEEYKRSPGFVKRLHSGDAEARKEWAALHVLVEHGTPETVELPPGVAAKQRIDALKTDQAFVERLNKGDVTARQEWTNLHKTAAGE